MAARAGTWACPYTIIDEDRRRRAASIFAEIVVPSLADAQKKPVCERPAVCSMVVLRHLLILNSYR